MDVYEHFDDYFDMVSCKMELDTPEWPTPWTDLFNFLDGPGAPSAAPAPATALAAWTAFATYAACDAPAPACDAPAPALAAAAFSDPAAHVLDAPAFAECFERKIII